MTISHSENMSRNPTPKLLIKITNKSVGKLAPPDSGYTIAWDSQIKGFGCRVTSSGVRSFIVNYRVHGREKRATLGRYGSLSADEARDLASIWLGRVSRGAPRVRRPNDEGASRSRARPSKSWWSRAESNRRPLECHSRSTEFLPLALVIYNCNKSNDYERYPFSGFLELSVIN